MAGMIEDNVIPFPGETSLPLDAKRMLAAISKEDDVEDAVALVMRADGTLTIHSSEPCGAHINLWLDKAKRFILNHMEDL